MTEDGDTSTEKPPVDSFAMVTVVTNDEPPPTKEVEESEFKEDRVAWAVSMSFLVLLLGAMWIWGNARDWYAQSGYGYSDENGTGRFPTEPFFCNDTSEIGRHGLPDCTANWYFWKLPTEQITALTRVRCDRKRDPNTGENCGGTTTRCWSEMRCST